MLNLNAPSPALQKGQAGHSTKIVWGQCIALGKSIALAASAQEYPGTSLIITETVAAADLLIEELRWILKDDHELVVQQFRDWETLAYDVFSPHQDIVSERLSCLYDLSQGKRSLIVVAANTLMNRIAPVQHIIGQSLIIQLGDRIEREQFRSHLVRAGYRAVDTVYEHGEFAFRGSLLDLYPMGSDKAYRIELFDEDVETLRTFDPETQRTIEKIERIAILPAKEYAMDDEGIKRFKQQWHENFDVDFRKCGVYQDVVNAIPHGGVEYYLPLFFEDTASLFDYLPQSTQIFADAGLESRIEENLADILQRYESRSGDIEKPVLPPQTLFLSAEEIFSRIKHYPRAIMSRDAVDTRPGSFNLAVEQLTDISADNEAQITLHKLSRLLEQQPSKRVLFCAETEGRLESLCEQLSSIDVTPRKLAGFKDWASKAGHQHSPSEGADYAICVGNIGQGVLLTDNNSAIISEANLYGQRVRQSRRRKNRNNSFDPAHIVRNLSELKLGAPIVHIDHGVGRYKGLELLTHGDTEEEFLLIEYQDEAKLYVPVASLHLVSRYLGADDALAPLHRLGSDQWTKARKKAAEKVRDVAAELLNIYAQREARVGLTYETPEAAYKQFVAKFPFEETPDQEQAIESVLNDMTSPQPMDRLVCGDVGFGKTEVAMRAAFIAIQNGKQVAVLVPTTLLAQQHYENFQDRFVDTACSIEIISRFKTKKETDEVLNKLAEGQVDIIVGTHRLIQGDIRFKDLGLMIIDEEHRFGVRQKEKLKSLRSEVDILTLTATPIPRTLNMSMHGIRDLSIIATPPAKRLSVKTFVSKSDNALITEAINREIMRGGQIYFLHNEVKSIERRMEEIQVLVPEARIEIAHGQMREKELEGVMSDFYHRRFSVLLCTTIIETGIDVPNANTIIIDRADKFGLAQLHQLRGRVGRSHHQAYAYLLTPGRKQMTNDAAKRLEAIAQAQDLGAGFALASQDLEIRGAGELLGDDQSGQIQSIGFSLYMDMLERATKAIKNGIKLGIDDDLRDETVLLNLRIPALIPDEYIADVHTRLILYKRIASAQDFEQLDELMVEMIDRFGLLPDACKNLFRQTRIKIRASRLGVAKIEATDRVIRLEFSANTQVDPLTLVQLVQSFSGIYQLDGANKLKAMLETIDANERLIAVSDTLEKLEVGAKPDSDQIKTKLAKA